MLQKKVALVFLSILCALVVSAFPQSATEQEVTKAIEDSYEYLNQNLKSEPDSYSKHGALEFWSSGGLLNEIRGDTRPEEYDMVSVRPKHIQVITLVDGQVAVAHFYAEGAMKPKGADMVSHYLTRASQVFVKEDGKWKVRSSHWSPVAGGSGTSQTTED